MKRALGVVLSLLTLCVACQKSPPATSQSSSSPPAPVSTSTPARAPLAITDPYSPEIDPATFSTTIDNPYLPMIPGTRLLYEADSPDGKQRTTTEVTRETKDVMGVRTVVVHDTVTTNGTTSEDTYDWFAQDRDGNVWYFGEDSKEFKDGAVDTGGSFEAGVDGALPGIVMLASPRVGDKYRQEYARGVAEDAGEIMSLQGNESTQLTGLAGDLLVIKDSDRLEPDAPAETKYYKKGVGLILTTPESGPPERDEAVRFEHF